MKVKPDSIQRWCALTLEQYKDGINHRTAAGIQEAHAIPNDIGPKEMSALESAWGLKAGALADAKSSSKNIIPLRADWRDCFDCGDFILLPRREVLARIQYFQYNKPEIIAHAIPWEELKVHHYVFIPIGKRSNTVPLFRREFKQGCEFQELVKDKGTFYNPPNFDDYPEIQSTVHPYCMIWKAIYEIGNKVSHNQIENINHRLLYLSALCIVEEWKFCMSPEARKLLTSRQPRHPPDSGDAHTDHSSPTLPSGPSEDDSDSDSGGESGGESDGDGGDSDLHVSDARNSGHQHMAHGSTLISYSNYKLSFTSSSPPKSAPSEKLTRDDESDVVEERPDNLAPYVPWNVGDWQFKDAQPDAQALDDLQDNHSSVLAVESLSLYRLENPAQLPRGPWEYWRPDFMKDMDEAKYRELAERFGMI
ncbi:uncharacterized protein STEHIDRAFT_161477 [Stereum hirsutum FP-91666 SS1]|uniref:uncharacterized protein n=1 Tax=Stereum hirsutum (strain FP-91666) TaxID=721885 RepID=UPI0004449994|nr:uncharacterized protein STEHIDRAFT_161477 [Stereum hirsutum FP-91666 SS1]EIM82131.1 hypothetical protein STEHIDRAFT_161477 [Stereum hirsutum FP-91666 SS1]